MVNEEMDGQSASQEPSRRSYREYANLVLLTLAFGLILKFFVVEAYRIPTESMENTLFAGDYLLVNKFVYGARTPRFLPFSTIEIPSFSLPEIAKPKRGEVVVFESPVWKTDRSSPIINYVKRCMALPGDTIEIRDRVVIVNGQILPNPKKAKKEKLKHFPPDYQDPRIYPRGAPYNADNYGPILVPQKGRAIALSVDELDVWQREFIQREGHSVAVNGNEVLIDGTPRTSYTIENDYYFMMGDNRRNSLDSRFWGFVPGSLILGKAIMVYWSWAVPASGSVPDRINAIRWNRIGTMVQ